ncbi:unnamed protein product [Prunus brigantina]
MGMLLQMEVDAIRAVLIACRHGGFARVMMESDSLIAIQMVNGERLVDAEVGGLIFDIQAMTRELQKVIFIHAPRSRNKAAHEAASFVHKNGGIHHWDFVPPEWLFINTLEVDARVSVQF